MLEHAKRYRPDVLTKTSLMLGLGEAKEEVIETMDDLRAIGVDIVTFGQYLRPTVNHLPVERFVTPDEFRELREIGLGKGFLEVVSGPLVRSSYRADRVFEKTTVGWTATWPDTASAGAGCIREPAGLRLSARRSWRGSICCVHSDGAGRRILRTSMMESEVAACSSRKPSARARSSMAWFSRRTKP